MFAKDIYFFSTVSETILCKVPSPPKKNGERKKEERKEKRREKRKNELVTFLLRGDYCFIVGIIRN